ncbi:EVE domain-containing protein [Paenibacillus sp. JNUCC31]|uniref:EVE domain-containing protein n=1 Tax=Paenibacillus sp. JNUCC-31 TaxID=2777983 RepID=UPI00178255F9|nr:EVE domain-containing protein [Paenibacillus sp. JNUCC-31]QOS79284.1 EVE domain-containing protein [Paenibacillus sp. JNUCC-31]
MNEQSKHDLLANSKEIQQSYTREHLSQQLDVETVSEEGNRYWIGVVSASHVEKGVEGGFAQLCHGKAASLRKMNAGDWLIYYSPRTSLQGGKVLQAFTAIGRVADNQVYTYRMSDSFVPYRRNVQYFPSQTVSIADLLDQLILTRGQPRWGYRFRYGHLQIQREDFLTIAAAMLGAEIENIKDLKFG